MLPQQEFAQSFRSVLMLQSPLLLLKMWTFFEKKKQQIYFNQLLMAFSNVKTCKTCMVWPPILGFSKALQEPHQGCINHCCRLRRPGCQFLAGYHGIIGSLAYKLEGWSRVDHGSLDWFVWVKIWTGNLPWLKYHQIDRAFRWKCSHHPILWMVDLWILNNIHLSDTKSIKKWFILSGLILRFKKILAINIHVLPGHCLAVYD